VSECVEQIGEMINTHLNVTEIPERKRPFGGCEHIRSSEDIENVVSIHLAQYTSQWQVLPKMEAKYRVPYKVGNFFTRCATISFSKTLLR
jgi:hypothetical protein